MDLPSGFIQDFINIIFPEQFQRPSMLFAKIYVTSNISVNQFSLAVNKVQYLNKIRLWMNTTRLVQIQELVS